MYINPTRLKHLRFHAANEAPIFNLTVSRQSVEWLLTLIPADDGSVTQLRKELERVEEQAVHGATP